MDIQKLVVNNHIKIYVKPNAKKSEVTGYDETRKAVKVDIKAPAEDNKANIEVIKFFKKLLKKEIKITKGLKSKEKYLKLK